MTLSLSGARWTFLAPDAEALTRASRDAAVLPTVARMMALRGFDAAGAWLSPSFDHLHDPFDMANMGGAVTRLRRAMAEGQRLRVITDYDVDGTTSSLILQATLGLLGPKVSLDYHIPDRFTEGYGFSTIAAEKAAADGVDLIVTADIGVRDHAAVTTATQAGVDVLICDHHLPPGADVPSGATVLCPPQQACAYPNAHLAACGVSLKLAQALLADHPKRDAILRSLLKLAAIGTVADLVPLNTLENRALVTLGVEALNETRNAPGLDALLKVAGVERGTVDEEAIGFRIGPRINAAGRMAHATSVVDLLTCRDPHRAATLAQALDDLNATRRDVQTRLVDHVLAEVGDDPEPFVVVAGPEEAGFHRGVVGIVAARVKEVTHRPVAIVAIQGEWATGSVRSVPGVHAVHALDAASDVLLRYGGHPMAAGFTLRAEHLGALREALHTYVREHRDDGDLIPKHAVDAQVHPADLTDQLYAQLRQLGPYGQANPAPRLVLPHTQLRDVRTMGKQGKHLKARLANAPVDVLWWNGAEHAQTLATRPVDLLGTLSENRWRGRRTLQWMVTDARVSEPT